MKVMSWRAEREFARRDDFAAVLWLTETTDGRQVWFDTPCNAPGEIGDYEAIAVLISELSEDFARDGVRAFAVAYPGTATFAAADASGTLYGTREIVRPGGRPPYPGVPVAASSALRFGGLAERLA
jgi:hypothetical protein